MKVGAIVRIKKDLLGISSELIGMLGCVVSIESKCEGEVVGVSLALQRGRPEKILYFHTAEIESHEGEY